MPAGFLRSALHCALALLAPCFLADDGLAVLVAFPGAEGAGAYATGGRGGDVYHVTSLADSGPGTLREGVNTGSGPRTIVFDVGGTINLTSRLSINRPNITIAGQTTPGNGICVASFRTRIQFDNTVVRYMHFRLGSDPITAADGQSSGYRTHLGLRLSYHDASFDRQQTQAAARRVPNPDVRLTTVKQAPS